MRAKKLGWLGIARLQDYVNIVTSRTGLTIKYDDKCTRSYTEGSTLVIPRVHSKLTDAMVDQIKYDVLTETLRQTEGTDFRYISATKIDNTHPLGYAFNVLESNRIERQGASKFRGDAKTLDKAYIPRVDEQLKMIEKSLAANPDMLKGDPGTTAMLSSILIDNMAREKWVNGAVEYTPRLQHILSGASESLKEFILSKADSLAEELNSIKTTEQAYNLAKKLYDESNPPPEPQADGSEGESESSKAEAEMQAGKEAKDKADAQGRGEGKGQEGEGKGEDGEGEPSDGKLKERPKYDWEQSFDYRENPKGHGMGLDYSDWSYKANNAYNISTDAIILDYVRGRLDGVAPRSSSIKNLLDINKSRYSSVEKLDSKTSRSFPNKVRRLLQIQMASRIVHAQPKGRKLDRKNLIRLPMGKGRPEMDDYSKRIFSSKENQLDLDVACTILCDFSGSMSGNKTTDAANALMLLNNVMGISLKLPLEILTFTEAVSEGIGNRQEDLVPLIGLYKYFDRPVTEHALYTRLRSAAEYQGQNGDADAISVAYHRLMQRPEKLKVLIVLSDGSPASSKHGDCMSATINVVTAIEKEGRVEIVGLGIQDDNVKRIYKNNEVMWDSSNLETVLLRTLSNYLFKT